jgi:hypothetical protein
VKILPPGATVAVLCWNAERSPSQLHPQQSKKLFLSRADLWFEEEEHKSNRFSNHTKEVNKL